MGVVNCSLVDTTPGANCAFAPPGDWAGDSRQYLRLMRKRWKEDPGARQVIACTAGMTKRPRVTVEYRGPYVEEAKKLIASLMAPESDKKKGAK